MVSIASRTIDSKGVTTFTIEGDPDIRGVEFRSAPVGEREGLWAVFLSAQNGKVDNTSHAQSGAAKLAEFFGDSIPSSPANPCKLRLSQGWQMKDAMEKRGWPQEVQAQILGL